MGRGLGATQRALLDTLAGDSPKGKFWWAIADLADSLDRSPRQIRTTVRALESRGLVFVQWAAVDFVPAERGWQWVGNRLTDVEKGQRDYWESLGFSSSVVQPGMTRRKWTLRERPVPGLIVAERGRAEEDARQFERIMAEMQAGRR